MDTKKETSCQERVSARWLPWHAYPFAHVHLDACTHISNMRCNTLNRAGWNVEQSWGLASLCGPCLGQRTVTTCFIASWWTPATTEEEGVGGGEVESRQKAYIWEIEREVVWEHPCVCVCVCVSGYILTDTAKWDRPCTCSLHATTQYAHAHTGLYRTEAWKIYLLSLCTLECTESKHTWWPNIRGHPSLYTACYWLSGVFSHVP